MMNKNLIIVYDDKRIVVEGDAKTHLLSEIYFAILEARRKLLGKITIFEKNKVVDDFFNKSAKKKVAKRIYNPITDKYYPVRQRTTSSGAKGQIKGL